ncbi:hypothetical protein PLEOSDRAFT_157920 [Pleurotus ostreatus PC15]|uniref:Uncharacterized protein n=1 Tax=Pleurotus ostreatus (strain PC15) TaxID=1137138 RepID=A0A067NX70_PLEO1|nr:hypothetical protein PLEOSDRAFT_157920 [Pleurotus ostreatus PC15]
MPTPNLSPRRAGKKAAKEQQLYLHPARKHLLALQSGNWRAGRAGARAAETAVGGGEGKKGHAEVANLCKQLEAICANPRYGYVKGSFLAEEIKQFRTFVESEL